MNEQSLQQQFYTGAVVTKAAEKEEIDSLVNEKGYAHGYNDNTNVERSSCRIVDTRNKVLES